MIIWGVLLGLFVLILLVVLHELGHAIVAKRNGVKVEEFGIGFPPAAKKWKVKRSFLGEDVTFSLNWLPLGGFVSNVAGMAMIRQNKTPFQRSRTIFASCI